MSYRKNLAGKKFLRFLMVLLISVFMSAIGTVAQVNAMSTCEYLNEWKNTKTEFEKKTGQKKPAKKFMGVYRKSSGIENSLKKVDKACEVLATKNRTGKTIEKKDVKKFNKTLTSFNKKKNKYIKQLKKALDKEKKADSAYAKGLKILKADLKAIYASADGQLELFKNAVGTGITRKSYEASFVKLLKGTIKEGKVFCKRVLSEKTPEDQVKRFNVGIEKAARNVTQNLTNIMKKMDSSDQRKKSLKKLSLTLEAWGNRGRKLSENATEKKVKKEVGAFNQALKEASKWAKRL